MIELRSVSKTFGTGDRRVEALQNMTIRFPNATMTAVAGPSGCGKSTLLNVVGLITRPTSGIVALDGVAIVPRSDRSAARLRNETFRYVVQDFALVESDTVLDNVQIPLVYAARRVRGKRRRVIEALAEFGVEGFVDHRVRDLSGGQRQRVALARAVVNRPRIVLADEPTGALDAENTLVVVGFLRRLVAEGHTVLIATHDPEVAALSDTVVTLRDGRIQHEGTASLASRLPRV